MAHTSAAASRTHSTMTASLSTEAMVTATPNRNMANAAGMASRGIQIIETPFVWSGRKKAPEDFSRGAAVGNGDAAMASLNLSGRR